MHTFISIGDYSIPKNVKCAHSATKGLGLLLESPFDLASRVSKVGSGDYDRLSRGY